METRTFTVKKEVVNGNGPTLDTKLLLFGVGVAAVLGVFILARK